MNGLMDPVRPWSKTLVAVLVAVLTATASTGCRRRDDPVANEFKEFNDAFERDDLGADWRDTGGNFHIEKGELVARNVRHHPIWLRRALPADVAIEFDAHTNSGKGDIRVILYGDGKSPNPDRDGCQSTGYALVFGGWKNTLSVICRGEQADGGHVRARSDWPVVAERPYHVYVTRKGGLLSWYIGGHTMLEWNDPKPLGGPDHSAFGFDGGEEEVFFDNLSVGPLPR